MHALKILFGNPDKNEGFFNKNENEKLTQELENVIECKKAQNMEMTLYILTNYLVQDQLKNTGLLYRRTDRYIQTKVQQLYWEWKNEGLINEFEDFEDTTKSWIVEYA